MTEVIFINRLNELKATSETNLIINFVENQKNKTGTFRILFRYGTEIPAIRNGKVGCKYKIGEGNVEFMVKNDGLKISDIIDIDLED